MLNGRKISFIMVGLGGMSDTWLSIFRKFKDRIFLSAVCDPLETSFKKLINFGFEYLPKFSSLEEAFSRGVDADAVLILTPPQHHFSNLELAIKNNYHIICEKPLLTSNDQFLSMKNLLPYIKRKNLTCAVNQQYRGMKRVEAIRNSIAREEIGEIGFCISNFCQNRYHFNGFWRQNLQDISQFNWFIHHYDTMRYILGRNPVSVRAKMIRVPWSKIKGDSTIFLNVRFEGGIEWSYTATQESIGGYEDPNQSSFTIYGSKGCIKNAKNLPPQIWLEKDDTHKPEISNLCAIYPEDKISTDTNPMNHQFRSRQYPSVEKTMEHFIKSVHSENKIIHPTGIEDNMHTIAIPLCARESHKNGGIEINIENFLGLKTCSQTDKNLVGKFDHITDEAFEINQKVKLNKEIMH